MRTQIRVKHVGILREYERGWGSKDFVAKAFKTKNDAMRWVNEQNAKNTETVVPDYYIQARYKESMSKKEFEQING
jgi:hypothetical protein